MIERRADEEQKTRRYRVKYSKGARHGDGHTLPACLPAIVTNARGRHRRLRT